MVQTVHGQLLALGTRFSVRQLADETLLEVYEGAVQVRPESTSVAAVENIIRAGQQVRFTRERLGLVGRCVKPAWRGNAACWWPMTCHCNSGRRH